jgi:nucleoside-diphosphate-sugar epimerase
MDPSASRVAVTGAAGFIGRAVRRRLEAEGVGSIVGLDLAGGDGVVACDVTEPAALAAALEGVTHVVHAAARVSDWGPMEEFVRVNVRGTRNVLDAAEAAGAERVLHVSSVAVWGYDFRADLDEDAPPRATGVPYIDTKAASELLARARGATIVRPGDVYGPGSIPWAVRPLEALKSGMLRLPGKAEGILTPVYVDDLADGIVRALLRPEGAGQAFTLWDGAPVTAAEFFAHYARMLGRDRAP